MAHRTGVIAQRVCQFGGQESGGHPLLAVDWMTSPVARSVSPLKRYTEANRRCIQEGLVQLLLQMRMKVYKLADHVDLVVTVRVSWIFGRRDLVLSMAGYRVDFEAQLTIMCKSRIILSSNISNSKAFVGR
jgi:hypothetical protein